MQTESITAAGRIAQRLQALVQTSPDLKDAALFYETILPLLQDAELHATAVSLTPQQARSKMEAGLPLLSDLDVELDVESVRELMLRLARAIELKNRKNSWVELRLPWTLASHGPDAAARRIRLALEENRLDVSALLSVVVAGERPVAVAASQDLQLDPGLLWTLAQSALRPTLSAWRSQLAPLAEGLPWGKGACFVCGASAVFGELRDNDQTKHLRCLSCGADWTFRRLQCPCCGNEDKKTLACLYEGDRREKMRIEVCDTCRGYHKVISSFSPTPPELLPVEDLATLHLDYVAAGRGYRRPGAK